MSSDLRPPYPFPVFAVHVAAPERLTIFERFDASATGTPSPPGDPHPSADAPLPPGVQQRIEEIGKEAYEKAFLLGEKAGRELGEAAVTSMVEKLAGLVEEVSTLRPVLLRESERELLDLSFQIARAIVGAEIETRPDVVLESARRAIQRIGAEGRITLRVHPSDANHVWKERDALFPYLSGKGDIAVEPDETIERGGCLAVTDYSEADATISGQFEVLKDRLRTVREERK